VLRKPLVKDVPGRKTELGLEQADDAEGAQEEAEDKSQAARAEAAAEDRGRPHLWKLAAGVQRARIAMLYARSCGE
jgi:hypothetical protein